jgi:hypothetical protein
MRLLAMLFLLGANSCAPEDIVAARHVSDAGGGQDSSTQASCATNQDCHADEFCSKKGCADERGSCEAMPQTCPYEFQPACGCDGLSYFSDCLRRKYGIFSSTSGECSETALSCGIPNGATCPSKSYCARLVPSTNRHDGEDPQCSSEELHGRCWVLPTSCGPLSSGGDLWNSCDGSASCVDTCSAIQSESKYLRAERCPLKEKSPLP